MNYFLIKEDDRIQRKLSFSVPGRFEDVSPYTVIQVSNSRPHDYVDWIDRPYRLLSDRMKSILYKYNRLTPFKRIDLIDSEAGLHHPYWAVQPLSVKCLSPHTEWNPDSTIKRLVLDSKETKGQHFFAVEGILEPYTFISLDAAESLLRRGFTGFVLKKVELI
ncbi:hypothetical protein D3C78_1471700 [compost metagenome]